MKKKLLSGDEAVALAALHSSVSLGTGYPGTPSTEILENFSALGGRAQWAPNEKVALEVAAGVAMAGGRAICTMKHVGLNVAADPLFTLSYIDTPGGLVVISADDPGMASSQNEQDNRRYALAAGVAMLEPGDSQEAYDFTATALELSERFHTPIILRLTTRICHSKSIVAFEEIAAKPADGKLYQRNIPGRVMIPAYARVAHRKMRDRLKVMQSWNEQSGPNHIDRGDASLGVITSGVCYAHVCEAAPDANVLKIGMTHPLPLETIRKFAASVERCLVIEEGDPYLVEQCRTAGVAVEATAECFRFGELNVDRVKKAINGDLTPDPPTPKGKPPKLCTGCPHRKVFETLRDFGCIVAGDIGCYTLGVLPPFEAIDTCVCMGASIGVGLGMRHCLAESDAKKVVSVIGDSTFMHSGVTGLIEMVYNPPKTGHVVIIMDNGTTAMTGLQEHPATGRALDHSSAHRVALEDIARAIGIERVCVLNPIRQFDQFRQTLKDYLESGELGVIITRQPCLLAAAKIRKYDAQNQEACADGE